MIVQAAPLKRHHQSEKSRQRAFLAAIRSRPSITPRRHLRRVVGIPAEDKRRGLFKSARAKNKGWFTAIFRARHGERERERSVSSFPPRGTSILGLAFNLSLLPSFLSGSAAIDSTLSISRIRHVLANRFRSSSFARVYARGGICRGFGSRDRFSLFWRRASFGISFEPRRGKEPSLI